MILHYVRCQALARAKDVRKEIINTINDLWIDPSDLSSEKNVSVSYSSIRKQVFEEILMEKAKLSVKNRIRRRKKRA